METAVLLNNETGEQKEMAVDWIVICIGTEPDTSLAQQAGLELEGAFVKINSEMMTSKPGIFACGETTGAGCPAALRPGPRSTAGTRCPGAAGGARSACGGSGEPIGSYGTPPP